MDIQKCKDASETNKTLEELQKRLANLYGRFHLYRSRHEISEPVPSTQPITSTCRKRSVAQPSFTPSPVPTARQQSVVYKTYLKKEAPYRRTNWRGELKAQIGSRKQFEMRIPSDENLISIQTRLDSQQRQATFETIHSPIDFVLVCTLENFRTKRGIKVFLDNLRNNGIEYVATRGLENIELVFILIHVLPTTLQHFAYVYEIEQRFRNNIPIDEEYLIKCMQNELTKPAGESLISHRNPEIFLPLSRATPSERIMITHKILSRMQYSDKKIGYKRMIEDGLLITGYPLHDGSCCMAKEGPLSFRTALSNYWGTFCATFKYQPLEVIERYYGSEVALYFAWAGYYNIMLIPAAIIGIIFFCLGAASFFTYDFERSTEICGTDIPMCPVCRRTYKQCKFRSLTMYCNFSILAYFMDNTFTVIFAIIMVFWSVFFVELWKRKEALLKLKWNLMNTTVDTYIRRQFEENAEYRRKSPVTGQMEAYVPARIKAVKYSFSILVCVGMSIVVLIGVISVIYFRLTLLHSFKNSNSYFLTTNVMVITMTFSSILSVIFIKALNRPYSKVSKWLTNRENPRTQFDYDQSYIIKRAVLSLINTFCPMFYLAFGKSTINTTPYTWSHGNILLSDICHPAGCIMSLCIQLMFLFLAKGLCSKLVTLGWPPIWKTIKKCFRKSGPRKLPAYQTLPQWERDYKLEEVDRYFLIGDYMELIIQFGLVTFFVAAFPLAPAYALINNILELRMDAYTLLHRMRRPIPRRQPGIGVWGSILKVLYWISIITNACIICFTSEFMNREIYKHYNGNLKGFIRSILSEFLIEDYDLREKMDTNLTICYYRGWRNPPSHPLKYKMRGTYWRKLSIRLIALFSFVHILFIVTGILAYAIPDMPETAKEHIMCQQNMLREKKIKQMNEKFIKERKQTPSRREDNFQF